MTKTEKIKKFVGLVLGVLVLAIGVYMVKKYDCPEPPALSGVAFILIGLALWLPNCMLMDYLMTGECAFKSKKK